MSDAAGMGGHHLDFVLKDRLRKALEKSGDLAGSKCSNSEMAQILGVADSTVSNYIAGTTVPKDGFLRQWALRCGVPYWWLKWGALEEGDPRTQGDASLPWITSIPGQLDFLYEAA